MKAYKSVIKSAIASGYHVHINDGEEVIRCGDTYRAAVEAVESVEESLILVRRPVAFMAPGEWPTVARLNVARGGWYDIPDEETVVDWGVDNSRFRTNVKSGKNWADRWYAAYDADNSFCGEVK